MKRKKQSPKIEQDYLACLVCRNWWRVTIPLNQEALAETVRNNKTCPKCDSPFVVLARSL